MKTLVFYNWSEEDFVWTWDSEPAGFKAGSKTMLPDYLAKHFAKHFVDRELIKLGLPVDHFRRKELLAKSLIGEIEQPSTLVAQIASLNVEDESSAKKPACNDCGSKGNRHKKDCSRVAQPTKTEEFAGLMP